jgi:hypothetical protein
MRKIITTAIITLLSLLTLPAQANDQKVLAIIDTAIDSSKFNNIIQEVCFTSNKSCSNGQNYMEGIGSANISDWKTKGNIDSTHGMNIVGVSTKIDPSVKIVFIRIMNVLPENVVFTDGAMIASSLDWLANNASKYSIDAVSISQNINSNTCGTVFHGPTASISRLYKQGVAVFASAGNTKNVKPTFPACVNNVYSVGAIAQNDQFFATSNGKGNVRFASDGCYSWTSKLGVCSTSFAGTSVSTIIVATKMVSLYNTSNIVEFVNAKLKQNTYSVIR